VTPKSIIMAEFFVAVYRFLRKHPALMWVLLVSTTAVFAFFAVQLKYEEDISKLLPQTEKAEKAGLAFGQISIKDKVFLQLTKADTDSVMADVDLAAMSDEFMDRLLTKDTASHLIANVLYRVEDEWTVNGLQYALSHFPSLVDTMVYAKFDSLLTRENINAQMEVNVEAMSNDFDGSVSTMICYDPAGLREALLMQVGNPSDLAGGYNIVDGHLFSKDGNVALAFLTPGFNYIESAKAAALIKMIDGTAVEFMAEHPEVEVLYHGNSVLSAGNSNTIKSDLVKTLSISLIIILIVILLCYRNKSTVGMLLLPIIYGTLMAMAFMFWIKGIMSLMAMGVGALVLGIAMSYVIHVLTEFKFVSDPEQIIRQQAKPVCLSCLTTIGAFAGLLFTDSDLLSDFGIFASVVLVGTTLCALIFMPQFFCPEKNRRSEKAFRIIEKIEGYAFDRNYVLLGVIAVVTVVCLFTSRKVKFDNDLNNIGYISEQVAKSQKLYDDKVNNGYMATYFAASAPDLNDALWYNKQVVVLLDSLKKQGVVKQYSSVADLFLTTEEQQRNINNWTAYWTPSRVASARRNIAAAARANDLEPEIFDPFFSLVTAEYDPELLYESGILPVELSSNFIEKVGNDYLVFTSALTLPKDADPVSDVVTTAPHALVCNPFYYTDDMVDIVHNDFNVVLLISSIFVLVVLLLTYRNLLLSLLAFLPMFLSWYIVQGLMAILGLQFNLINIILSSFIFGVGVDYSIFIMDGLLTASRGGDLNLMKYHKTAITFSAFILVVVVASLLLCEHPALYSVGACTLIGMSAAVLLSYSVQPFLFRLLMNWPHFQKVVTRH